MSAKTDWMKVQAVLQTKQDGIPGPKDEAALKALKDRALQEHKNLPKFLTGRGLTVYIEGDDLVLKDVRCTCFGGINDPQDSGATASGISTKPPSTMGCALPRNYTGSHKATRVALEGSPIPERLPWHTKVEVKSGSKKLIVPFIDLGPNLKTTKNALDLTVAAAKKFKANASATNFEMMCDYRIIGGAKYL